MTSSERNLYYSLVAATFLFSNPAAKAAVPCLDASGANAAGHSVASR